MSKGSFFTSKELKPTGWLKRQLRIQAEGLSGNLDKIWPDVRDSAWIGGDREGWERVPYWLDGFIPLAYLLEDEDMIARAKKYIDAILAAQKEDGWICPCTEEERTTYDTWAVQLISKVLTVYYECSGDERIPEIIYRVLKNYYTLLSEGTVRLFKWGQFRWYEAFIAIRFVYERYPEAWLLDLAKILKEQGTDYESLTQRWERPLNKWTLETHIVNLAMMLKYEAVSCDLLGESYTDKAEALRTILDRYNGTVYESFTGDECLSGISPIQGTECCAIVEQMYSYELLYAYTGDAKWLERLEVLAFNALPATISEDMWSHQYVQMSNQISCETFPGKPLFRTNRADAHIFGLEPNFGCCTANFNQGWPKFALSAFVREGNTVTSCIPLPCNLNADGIQICVETDYPFENSVKYTLRTEREFTFKVRIPSFAENLRVNGQKADGRELSFEIRKGTCEISLSFDVSPRFQSRPLGLSAVRYGSLIFSLPIANTKRTLEYEKDGVERKFPYCDYELIPQSHWNRAYSSKDLEVRFHGVGDNPFSERNPPLTLVAKTKAIDWGYEDGYETVCAKVPQSLVPKSEEEETVLHPYGCAKLRMTELPLLDNPTVL